ncbi:hypothetical protein RLOC_00001368 [Lonchura striata]|uniref:Uncharacterized protein n=1 Tax=Lonchura striata TaxID=40157 RepID=A0A218V7P5_9PASE|nr:hypothetical protein RLOC_00001368 [Lonchura striata domestica]
MSFLCWPPRAGAALQVGSQQSRAEGQNPLLALLPTLLWMQPRTRLALWAGSAHGWVMSSLYPQHPQVFLGRAALVCPSPACAGTGGCPDPGAPSTSDLVKPQEVPMGTLLELAQVPLDGIPSFSKACILENIADQVRATPSTSTGWGWTDQSSPAQKDLGVLWVEAGHDPAMGTPSPESQTCPGLHPKQRGQQGQEGILPLCSALLRAHLQGCTSSGGPAQEGHGAAGGSPEEVTRMTRGIKNSSARQDWTNELISSCMLFAEQSFFTLLSASFQMIMSHRTVTQKPVTTGMVHQNGEYGVGPQTLYNRLRKRLSQPLAQKAIIAFSC